MESEGMYWKVMRRTPRGWRLTIYIEQSGRRVRAGVFSGCWTFVRRASTLAPVFVSLWLQSPLSRVGIERLRGG
jgi:hypothetical protein